MEKVKVYLGEDLYKTQVVDCVKEVVSKQCNLAFYNTFELEKILPEIANKKSQKENNVENLLEAIKPSDIIEKVAGGVVLASGLALYLDFGLGIFQTVNNPLAMLGAFTLMVWGAEALTNFISYPILKTNLTKAQRELKNITDYEKYAKALYDVKKRLQNSDLPLVKVSKELEK